MSIFTILFGGGKKGGKTAKQQRVAASQAKPPSQSKQANVTAIQRLQTLRRMRGRTP